MRTRWVATGQNGADFLPQVRSNTSGKGQHRHIAADAVALAGDLLEFPDHRLLGGGIAVIELQGIRPAGKIGIPAISQDQVRSFSV